MKYSFFNNEKVLFRIMLVEIAVLLFWVIIATFMMRLLHLGQRDMKEASHIRYQSYILADQLRQSSDDLTRMVRSYAITGDQKFENYFWDILDIRDGKKNRPVHYEQVYWDFMTTKHPAPPSKKGDKVSLEELMKKAGFTQEELQLLSDAQQRSDKLVSFEKIAIQAVKGRFQDEKGTFTVHKEPDLKLATQILFSEKYHQTKKEIMEPINVFFKSIDQRTLRKVTLADSQMNFYQTSLVLVFTAIILNGFLLLLTINKYQRLFVGKLKTAINRQSLEIMERKQGEVTLRKNEEKYRRLVESLEQDYLIYSHNTKGIFTYISPSIKNVLGYTPEEFLKHYSEYFTDNPINIEGKKSTEMSIKGIQQPPYEIELHHKNRSVRVLEVTENPIFNGNNQIIAVEGIAQDITIKKQNEQNLRESVETNQALLNAPMDASILLIDKQGTVYALNETAAREFGRKKEDLLNVRIFSLLEPELAKAREEYINEVYRTGQPIRFEDKNKDTIFDNNIYPIFNTSGEVIRLAVYARDITKQNKLEKKLRQSQKMESIGNLAGGIAHDFNNILSVIFGFSDLAMEDIENPDALQDHLQEIIMGAVRAKDLVKQILTFSRKTDPEKLSIQMSLTVKEVIKMLRSTLPATIKINQEIDSNALIYADSTQIYQIVMNLCTNAYHAMRETGGILTISVKELKIENEQNHTLFDGEPGCYIRLEVSDTGHGMDDDTIKKIFDPYFTTKATGEGTGLGLAVVHGIVKAHNGYINLTSKQGKGTTFYITLPIIDASTDDGFSTDITNDGPMDGKESLLLVDDELKITVIANEAFSAYGYNIKTFTDGEQAFEEFEKEPERYDMLITDMTMPSMTGLMLAKKILTIKPDIPVILCTGHSDLMDKEKALADGIKYYYEKPVRISKLIRIVRKILDESKL